VRIVTTQRRSVRSRVDGIVDAVSADAHATVAALEPPAVVEHSALALAAAVAVLVVANVMSNRVLPDAAYVPWNLAVAGMLIAIAVHTGLVSDDLGFHRWWRGMAFGGMIVAATVAIYTVALAVPSLRGLFDDDRVSASAGHMMYQAFIRIPLGTVLLEEMAFRSVIPALSVRRLGMMRAYVFASVLFGLWHVLPALHIGHVNPVVDDIVSNNALGTLLTVVAAVALTTLAGIGLSLLRVWSGSVAAPVLAHLSTNSVGYVIAWFVTR
jgi:membrane protease YdiL (CAAX protease family)